MDKTDFYFSAFVLTCLLIFTGCQDKTAHLDELQKSIETFDKAWDELDFETAAGYYSKKATSFAPDQEVKGYPEIMANYEKMSSGEDTLHNQITDINRTRLEIRLEGKIAYELVTQSVKIQEEGHEPIFNRGKYIHIWEQQADGSWKIVFDMYNNINPSGE